MNDKKITKLPLLILLPIALGVALIIAGSVIDSYPMRIAGVAVLFGGSFAVAVIMSIVMIVGAVKGAGANITDGAVDQADEEERRLAQINSTHGADNKLAQAEHEIAHIKRAYKHADRGDKIKGGLFAGFLIVDFFMIIVFAMVGLIVGAIVCFSLFVGTILISLIITKIVERRSLSAKPTAGDDGELKTAIVETCVMSSSTTVGDRSARVADITYRVQLDVDGKKYNAYSKKFYNDGDALSVWVRKNGKTVGIIDDDIDEPTEYMTDDDIEIEAAGYRDDLMYDLEMCADDDERARMLRAERHAVVEEMLATKNMSDDEARYAKQLHLKKVQILAELTDKPFGSADEELAPDCAEPDEVPPHNKELAQADDPAPETEAEPCDIPHVTESATAPTDNTASPAADEAPQTPPIDERSALASDHAAAPRPKRTTVEYKGIKKK